MKTQHILILVIFSIVLTISSCREVTVTTKVNADGTFTRIITVTGDSTDVLGTDLPFPVDETWDRISSRDTVDSTKYIVKYTKFFRNSNSLNEEIQGDTNKYNIIEKHISVSKRFRFFYSFLTFKEDYKSVYPFDLDYRKYLTEDDIQWYSDLKIPITPGDSIIKNMAEDKVTAFFIEAATDKVESIIKDGITKLDNPGLNSVALSLYHDSLYKVIDGWDFKKGADFITLYRNWTGNEAFSLLTDLEPKLFEDFDGKMALLDNLFNLRGYTEEVEMPGLITATNSAMLKGNLVRWEFEAMPLLIRDIEFNVESRVINYWAFILAGIVLLGLVVVVVIKALR